MEVTQIDALRQLEKKARPSCTKNMSQSFLALFRALIFAYFRNVCSPSLLTVLPPVTLHDVLLPVALHPQEREMHEATQQVFNEFLERSLEVPKQPAFALKQSVFVGLPL